MVSLPLPLPLPLSGLCPCCAVGANSQELVAPLHSIAPERDSIWWVHDEEAYSEVPSRAHKWYRGYVALCWAKFSPFVHLFWCLGRISLAQKRPKIGPQARGRGVCVCVCVWTLTLRIHLTCVR